MQKNYSYLKKYCLEFLVKKSSKSEIFFQSVTIANFNW